MFPSRMYIPDEYVRLGFAVASHLNADVLLLDEVFAVGDGAFQRKCLDRILQFKRNGGTIVFVSHDAQAVERLGERRGAHRGGAPVLTGWRRARAVRVRRAVLAQAQAAGGRGRRPTAALVRVARRSGPPARWGRPRYGRRRLARRLR